MPCRILLAAIAAVGCAGCGSSYDAQATLDAQIADQWIAGRQLVDAVDYFEGGGHFEDTDDPQDPRIDRPVVLPLVRQLRDMLNLEVFVILDKADEAFALIVALPEDKSTHQEIRDTLNQADDAFHGVVMHNWGYRWIAVDFLDDMETDFVREAGLLDEIREQQQ